MGNWLTIRFRGNQKGFAALESLLILVIIAIIGGVGYYVWHSKKQTKNVADSSQLSTIKKSSTVSDNQKTKSSLTIKEWGIKIPLTDQIKDAYYTPDSGTLTETFTLRVHSLDGEPACTTSEQMPAYIKRISSADLHYLESQHEVSAIPPGADIDGYYYYIGIDKEDNCVKNPNNQTLLNNVRDAFNNASAEIEAE
jgi:hypothetical protein